MNFTVTENTVSVLDRLSRDLRDLIESLQDSGSRIQDPGAPQDLTVYAVPQTHAEEPKPATTLEEVRKVLVAKAREGKNDAVRGLLERFHAASLPEVDPADYADLLSLGKDL